MSLIRSLRRMLLGRELRHTLAATKAATFSVDLPAMGKARMPSPVGTGFFVSPDGWFVTAAHVVSVPVRVTRGDIDQGWLKKENPPGQFSLGMCQNVQLSYIDHELDVAVLKVDFQANADKEWLKGKSGFPFIEISARVLEEGEEVYSFGYPLPWTELLLETDNMTIGHAGYAPRVTSAIVSSRFDRTEPVSSPDSPLVYALDKALNYGNSGGPIVAVRTGRVHAVSSRFQPVSVFQRHLAPPGKPPPYIEIPSLYSIAVSLGNRPLIDELRRRGVSIRTD